MGEAFADAQAGVMFLPQGDLAVEVDGAQRVINAACAVQALRVTRRVRRVLSRVDADALRVKAAKERLDRFVHAYPSAGAGADYLGGVAARGGLRGVLGRDR